MKRKQNTITTYFAKSVLQGKCYLKDSTFRYVLDGTVKEVFADFVEVERITGKEIAVAIERSLAAWDIPLQYLRGQCYDGAPNMAGARLGCSAIIREKVPLAVYHHCAAHRLNLAIVSHAE